MTKIDVRFSPSDMAEIQSMADRKMVMYKCDSFAFFTSVYGIVGIAFEDASYAFTNLIEVMDYFRRKKMLLCSKLSASLFQASNRLFLLRR